MRTYVSICIRRCLKCTCFCDIRNNCVIIPDNIIDIVIVTKLPFAEFVGIELFLGRFIAKFHVINTRSDVALIQIFYKIIRKEKVIDQSAVSEGTVHYLNVRSE